MTDAYQMSDQHQDIRRGSHPLSSTKKSLSRFFQDTVAIAHWMKTSPTSHCQKLLVCEAHWSGSFDSSHNHSTCHG
jgi:hypothetical protein